MNILSIFVPAIFGFNEQPMKLRFFVLLLGAVAYVAGLSGQEQFTFQNQMRDTVHFEVNRNDLSSHYLGVQIAVKYYRLKETYTYVEAGSVSNPGERTIVMKPTIYYSLKRLNSHYKKQLRKGAIDSIEAVEELGWYFDVGFAIYEQDTSDFERALKSARNPDEIAQVFAHVILQ